MLRNEVEADDTPLVVLVWHGVFIGRPEGRYSGGGVEGAIVDKGQSDERARSRRPGRSPAPAGSERSGEPGRRRAHADTAGPTMLPVSVWQSAAEVRRETEVGCADDVPGH